MSNQLALILSIPFILGVLLFGTDIVLIQSIYSSLDSISTTISYKIATIGVDQEGNVDRSIDNFLKTNMDAYLIKGDDTKTVYLEGDLYPYILIKDYKPFVLSASVIKVRIKRYAVLGIYHS